MSSNSSKLRDAKIEQAVILSVNPNTWTMVVRTNNHNRNVYNVQIPSLYLHHKNGEGIHYMPEPGSTIWLCIPSDSKLAFPICGAPAPSVSGFRHNRPKMNPGDVFLTSRDGNGVFVKRGGTTEVSASPVCKSIWTQWDNAQTLIGESIKLWGIGGTYMEVETDRPDEHPDGKIGTRWSVRTREFLDDSVDFVELTLGRVDPTEADKINDAPRVVELRVDDGSTFDWGISLAGDIYQSYNSAVYEINDYTIFKPGDKVYVGSAVDSADMEPVLKADNFQTKLGTDLSAIIAVLEAVIVAADTPLGGVIQTALDSAGLELPSVTDPNGIIQLLLQREYSSTKLEAE